MYTLSEYDNITVIETNNIALFNQTLLPPLFNDLPTILTILILSILCFFGVVFMVFGPMMRSEAWKRVDNFIFGRGS
jgi:hypothetical protein